MTSYMFVSSSLKLFSVVVWMHFIFPAQGLLESNMCTAETVLMHFTYFYRLVSPASNRLATRPLRNMTLEFRMTV